MKTEYKVGDKVGVKYDVEQSGVIVKVTPHYAGTRSDVKIGRGGFNSPAGTVVEFLGSDFF